MLTPKQLRLLGEILSQETLGSTPSLQDYVSAAVAGQPIHISHVLRISRAGRLEASRPNGPKAFANRLIVRALVRTITRAARAGIPVGEATQMWLREVLCASDMAREANDVLRKE